MSDVLEVNGLARVALNDALRIARIAPAAPPRPCRDEDEESIEVVAEEYDPAPWNDVYGEIKRELIARGIPAGEIQFIQHHNTKAKKSKLFSDVNAGRVRVLLCSKQSTGMNVQRRLIALHHVDCPWRPGDLEQREGRIVRQKNQFPEVMVGAYVTEGSFDGYRWQTVETKGGFIEQMRRGDVTVRSVEDIGDSVASAAEIKALASGNPLVMEKVKADMELQKLEAAEAADREGRVRLRSRIAANARERERIQRRQPLVAVMLSQAQATAEADFQAVVVNGVLGVEATAYSKREAAGQAVIKVAAEIEALATQKRESQRRIIGSYRGFELRCVAYMMGKYDVLVQYIHEGEAIVVNGNGISFRTPSGVLASIDAQLRDLEAEAGRLTKRLAELDEDDSKAEAMLAVPWERATELEDVRARVERLNAMLDQSKREVPPAPEVPDPEGLPADSALVVTATSDEEQIAVFVPEAMERPMVLLPTPNDPEAMARAIRVLAGQAVEGAAALEANAEEAEAEMPEVLELPPAALEMPARMPVLAAPQPKPAPEPVKPGRLVFGMSMLEAVKRSKALRPKAQAAPATSTLPLDMFGTGQLDLFGTTEQPTGGSHIAPTPAATPAQASLW